MTNPITAFRHEHHFLSNFYLSPVVLDGAEYLSVEHAYQAAKTLVPEERARIRGTRRPGAAKHLGRRVTLRPDWDEVRVDIMQDLVRQKFARHADLRNLLLATDDRELVEGNYWGDVFWGQCPVGVGQNWLGRILMRVRAEIRGTFDAV